MTRGLLDHHQQTANEMMDSVRFQHFVLMLACAPKFPQFSEEMFPGALFVVAPKLMWFRNWQTLNPVCWL
jgi:hypothetical protein